jgi:hypothetical protein
MQLLRSSRSESARAPGWMTWASARDATMNRQADARNRALGFVNMMYLSIQKL